MMVRSEFEICHCIPYFTNNDSHIVVSLLSYLITKKKFRVHSEAYSCGLQINSLQRQGRTNNGTNKKLDDQGGHSKPGSKSLDSEITYLKSSGFEIEWSSSIPYVFCFCRFLTPRTLALRGNLVL